MGLAHQMAEVLRAKVNTALERAEDPRELLDYSYTLQQDLLRKVRCGLVETATARERVENRRQELRESAAYLAEQAEKVLAAGHDELARQALTTRARILERTDELSGQQADLRAEEERLSAAAERLQAKADAFAHRKEILKARYTLAEAETYLNETMTGISEEMTDVSLTTRRAQDKTAQAHAHVAALDDLLTSRTLPGAVPGIGSEVFPAELQARLDEATTRAAVDEELRAMKNRLADQSQSRERHR